MAKQAQQVAEQGFVARSRAYLDGVRSEMAKVTWPGKEELKASTVVVLVFLVILAVVIGAMDLGFQKAFFLLFELF
jgi:preprotein translocase subunit SecE